ncbi:hypothetical protein [Alkalihalobacillus sp. BA299]|uniref:hypothetical protein n=1 Tax=Alkalihalobacillus sp. BA299 TaxID=2815938 RepID=UPI0027DB1915|nr:hypothetical protein [Alkalihalobacillus sp. BA299]
MYRQMNYPGPLSVNPPSWIEQKAIGLIGQPVGISLKNGQGVSGVLCSVQSGEVFVMQYLYATQFATFHYSFNNIKDIHAFPSCNIGSLY